MPASASASSRSLPAGPTNGAPARSSWSPGCSPTNMTSDFGEPSPKTVCVPVFQSGQALQPAAASVSFLSEGRVGTSGAAVSSSRLCWVIATFGYPGGVDTMRPSGAVAEWLGRGLQSLVHQFDSGRRLSRVPDRRRLPAGGAGLRRRLAPLTALLPAGRVPRHCPACIRTVSDASGTREDDSRVPERWRLPAGGAGLRRCLAPLTALLPAGRVPRHCPACIRTVSDASGTREDDSGVPDRRRLPAGGAGLRRRLAPLTALLPAGRVPRHCPACIRAVSDASGTREDDSRVPDRWRLPAGGAGLRRCLAPLTALLPAGRVPRHCPACIRTVSDASGTREDDSRVPERWRLPAGGAGLRRRLAPLTALLPAGRVPRHCPACIRTVSDASGTREDDSRVPERWRLPAGGAGLRRRLAPLTALLPAGRVARHCPACIRTVSDASGTREDDSRVPERRRLPAGGAGLRRRLAPLTALLPAGRVARHCPACIRTVSDASGTREDDSGVPDRRRLPAGGAGLRRRLAPLTALLPAGRVPRHCPACIRTVSDASGTREDDSRVPDRWRLPAGGARSEEHTSELQSLLHLVCRPRLEQETLQDHCDAPDRLEEDYYVPSLYRHFAVAV